MTRDILIGEALLLERERRGWTRSEMANWMGISRSLYTRLETGKSRNPTLKTIWVFFRECIVIEAKESCLAKLDHLHLVAESEHAK